MYAAPNKCLKPPQSDKVRHIHKGMVAPPLGFNDSKNCTVTQPETPQFPVLDYSYHHLTVKNLPYLILQLCY